LEFYLLHSYRQALSWAHTSLLDHRSLKARLGHRRLVPSSPEVDVKDAAAAPNTGRRSMINYAPPGVANTGSLKHNGKSATNLPTGPAGNLATFDRTSPSQVCICVYTLYLARRRRRRRADRRERKASRGLWQAERPRLMGVATARATERHRTTIR